MKKFIIILPLLAILFLCLFCLIPRHPFADVKDKDVDKIVIIDGKLSYTLSESEQKELIPLINSVIVYEKNSLWKNRDGNCGPTVEIYLSDQGQATTVVFLNDYVVIDDQGYRCKYEPCSEVTEFLYRITAREFYYSPQKPFESLQFTDIESVKIVKNGVDYMLDAEETLALVEILASVNTYALDQKLYGYSGDPLDMFTVIKKDGTSFTVSFSNPTINIDGVYYVSEEEQIKPGESLLASLREK